MPRSWASFRHRVCFWCVAGQFADRKSNANAFSLTHAASSLSLRMMLLVGRGFAEAAISLDDQNRLFFAKTWGTEVPHVAFFASDGFYKVDAKL